MHWGTEQHKRMRLAFLLAQHAFLADPGEVCPYLPDALDVDISNRCNLRCISCFHSVKSFRHMPDMTMETFTRVLDQAQGKASRITIGNHGEPFMHPKVLEMLALARRRGFFVNFICNGTLLTRERAQALVDIGVDRLTFSVDSVDPVVYPQVRRHGDLATTLANILYLLKINCEAGLPIYVNVSMVDTEQALSAQVSLPEFFARLPVHVVYTSPIINFHDMLDIREQTKYRRDGLAQVPPAEQPRCSGGFGRLLIRPNGDVSLCGIDWASVNVVGNVNQEDYAVLWNNDKARAFRRALLDRDYAAVEAGRQPMCSRCDAKWPMSVENVRQGILDQLAADLCDTKDAMDARAASPERMANLLRELDRLGRSGDA